MSFPRRQKPDLNPYAARRQEALKAARKRRRDKTYVNILAGLIVIFVAIGFITCFAVLGAVIIYLGWNIGVVGVSHALHGHVAHIGLLTAFGLSLALSALSRLFGGLIKS